MIYLDIVNTKEKGVRKKILFQIKAFEKYGEYVKHICVSENKEFEINKQKKIKILEKKTKISRLLRKIKIEVLLYYLSKLDYSNHKIIYIRYFSSSYMFLYFLRKIKEQYDIKIIIEIPTYPYDGELKGKNIFYTLDKKCRKKLYKYVDKIVTYTKDKKIWNIPCINISNGVDLEEIKIINKEQNEYIKFTSVSNCSFWHGIDRFLISLEKYGQNKQLKNIIFNIIGEGPESEKLKEIVEKSKFLRKIVIFHGFKTGKDLEKIYNETDIGIGSLGIHRIALKEVQPLKNREYTAKGLPFIIGFNDPDFEESKYVYKVTNNEGIIDIENIIKWYLKYNFKEIEIRKDAERFSWDIQMKKVIDNI